MDGRGTQVVPLVENTQLSIGGGQALSMAQLGCVNGPLGCAFALVANVELFLLSRHLCSQRGKVGVAGMGVVTHGTRCGHSVYV